MFSTSSNEGEAHCLVPRSFFFSSLCFHPNGQRASHHCFPIASNLLKRDFTADAPIFYWVADITFIETREGWLYLSGVLDTYSRKIVGWAMDKSHDAALVKTALQMALLNRHPAAGLIHHSDRKSRICQHQLSTAAARAKHSGKYEQYRGLL